MEGCASGTCLARMEAAGEVRVLHRLRPRPVSPRLAEPGVKAGLIVDSESTGLGPDDEVVELAMLPFSYDGKGRVLAVHEAFSALREPSRPIPAAVTALTGIDAATVRGRRVPLDEVEAVLARADVVLAHNSSFDRRLLEGLSPGFARKPWGCSLEDAGWAEEGIDSARLGHLATVFGLFCPTRHRALEDCQLLLEILSGEAPVTGGTVLAKVLSSARRGRVRVSAFGPFAAKDALRAAGYRWHPGAPGRPKCWFKDVLDRFAAAVERESLARMEPPCRAEERLLTPWTRFSERAWGAPAVPSATGLSASTVRERGSCMIDRSHPEEGPRADGGTGGRT